MRKFCLKLEWDEAYVCRFSEKQSEPLLDISYPSLPLFGGRKRRKKRERGGEEKFFRKNRRRPLVLSSFQIEKKKSSSQQQQQQHTTKEERESVCACEEDKEEEKEEEEEKDGYRSRHGGFVFIESVQKVQNSRLGKDERALHSLGIFDRASGVDIWNYVFSLGRAINRAITSRGTDDGDGERTNGSVGGSATTAAATIITLILESLKLKT